MNHASTFHLPDSPVLSPRDEYPTYYPMSPASSTDETDMDTSQGNSKRRKRTAIACERCRKAHATCDSGRPCSRCLKNGYNDCRNAQEGRSPGTRKRSLSKGRRYHFHQYILSIENVEREAKMAKQRELQGEFIQEEMDEDMISNGVGGGDQEMDEQSVDDSTTNDDSYSSCPSSRDVSPRVSVSASDYAYQYDQFQLLPLPTGLEAAAIPPSMSATGGLPVPIPSSQTAVPSPCTPMMMRSVWEDFGVFQMFPSLADAHTPFDYSSYYDDTL